MNARGISIKVISVSGSFVSFKYQTSNARSRIRKDDFMRDYKNGIFDVSNPGLLAKD